MIGETAPAVVVVVDVVVVVVVDVVVVAVVVVAVAVGRNDVVGRGRTEVLAGKTVLGALFLVPPVHTEVSSYIAAGFAD